MEQEEQNKSPEPAQIQQADNTGLSVGLSNRKGVGQNGRLYRDRSGVSSRALNHFSPLADSTGSPGAEDDGRGMEEIRRMDFVTVDEVGEEEEEEAVATRRGPRGRKRARQTSGKREGHTHTQRHTGIEL